MDFLKKQLTKLQQQYATLTASQKMLAVSLVAIMVMTLIWWGKYAGQAEMEEVIAQDFPVEQIGQVTSQLTSKGIPAKPNGARVMVPADRKIEALSYLSFAQLLPRDTSSAFEDIISKMSSPIDPPSKTDSIHNHAREVMLAQMIRYFPKVRSAMVAIDPNVHRSFDNSIMPTATVTIQLNPSERVDKRLVMAAADAVVGSVAGMERKRVKVIVDGASQPIDDGEFGDMSGSSMLDRIRDYETYYSRQVQDQLSVEGSMVHVTVSLNDEHSQIHMRAYDPKSTVKAEKSTSTDNEENTTISRGSSDPGLNANGPISVPGPATGGDQTHTLRDKGATIFENQVGLTEKWTTQTAGLPTVKSASISLPRSYFAKMCQYNMGLDKEPTKAVLDPFIDEQLPIYRHRVKGCLPIDLEDNIVISTYTDVMPVVTGATAQASSGVSMLIGGHVKEIALGALALVSLFMVSTMVRKATPVAKGVGDLDLLDGGAGPGGKGGKGKSAADDAAEVGEGVSTLDGVEMDSESIRGQQMMEQVTTLVKENPDAAANLVKRWLNRA